MWNVSSDPADFDAAVEWFRKRVPVSDEDWKTLTGESRRKAFKVAGVAQLDTVTAVWDALEKAIAQGTTLEEFRKAVQEKLTREWGSARGTRIETIFRTNLQLAYSAGRYRQMNDQDVVDRRPFRMYSAVMDSRTSEICRPLDGTVLPADDEFWKTHVPPLHFNCRAQVLTLTEDQAGSRGVAKKAPEAAPPLDGFGLPPEESDWKLEAAKYPKPLLSVAKIEPGHRAAFWEPHYSAFGDAAAPMAAARATLERGLDRRIKELVDPKVWPAQFRDLATELQDAWAKSGGKDATTVRELLAGATPAEAARRKAAAALYEHLTAVKGSTAKLEVRQTGEPNKPRVGKKIVDEFQASVGSMLHSSAQTPTVTVRWLGPYSRAHYNTADKIVAIRANADSFDKATLHHEFGHALEDSDERRARAAMAFLRKRTAGEEPKLLSVVTGNAAYGQERARKDEFFNAYVGKVYEAPPQARRQPAGRREAVHPTEITSMGFETLFRKPGWLMERDEEHFLFTLGQLGDW